MRLELPFEGLLPAGGNILIAGMGGGFDVFCGLPVYCELQSRGYKTHLASLSFAELREYHDCMRLSPTLVGVDGSCATLRGYHPEQYLARWFQDRRGELVTIWCFEPVGAHQLIQDYVLLTERLKLDAVILVDGGVDSLTRGDEEFCGTILEDYLSLTAVSQLESVPVRLMACIGMGVERDVSHTHVLENVAALTSSGGFLGVSALTSKLSVFPLYEDALGFVNAQPEQQPSVINASILSAAQGYFGDYHLTDRTRGSELAISPLMNIYWFFNAEAVAAQNLFMADLIQTQSMSEAFGVTYEAREKMPMRVTSSIWPT